MHIQKKVLNDLHGWMEQRDDIPDGWIYLGDHKERYILGQPGLLNMLVCGVNPSTAVPGRDDPTIRKVRRITAKNDYDGWIMINLYPLIESSPEKLPAEPEDSLISMNISVIKSLVKAYKISSAWAAWGDLIDKRDYLGTSLVKMLEKCDFNVEWYHCGDLTRRGNPRHPLYLKTDSEFQWFAVSDYADYYTEAEIYR